MPREDRASTVVLALVALAVVVFVLWDTSRPWPPPPPAPDVPSTLPTCKVPAEVSPPPKLEVREQMAVFGMTKPLDNWRTIADTDSAATAFPYVSGAPSNSYYYWLFSQPIGSWDDPISPVGDSPNDYCYCTYAVLDAGGRPTALWAYLRLTAVTQLGRIAAGLYDEGGTCIVGSEAQLFTEDYTGWVEFPVETEIALQDGTSYAIWVRGDYDALNDLVEIAYGDISEYVPPTEELKVSGSDTLVLDEALSGYGPGFAASDALVLSELVSGYGPGISAQDTLVLSERARHGGIIAPCAGRYVPPEPDEHQANPHRWRG